MEILCDQVSVIKCQWLNIKYQHFSQEVFKFMVVIFMIGKSGFRFLSNFAKGNAILSNLILKTVAPRLYII